MLKSLAATTVLCLCLSIPATDASVYSQIYNDMNTVSNGWNDVADALEETAGDDIGNLDIARLESKRKTRLGPTQELSVALVEYSHVDEQAVGEGLPDVTGEFYDIDGDDLEGSLVDVIDVVDDDCDASND
jgi:hypothetical protein